MSSRKSDSLATLPLVASPPRGWARMALANAPIPVALLALCVLGWLVEYSRFVGAYPARIIMLVGINIILAVSLQLINGISGQFSLGHAGFMAIGAYLAGYTTGTYTSRNPATDELVAFACPGETLLFYLALVFVLALAGAIIYGIYRLILTSRAIGRSMPAVLMVALLIWVAVDLKLAHSLGRPAWYTVWSMLIHHLAGLFHWLLQTGARPAAWLSGLLPMVWRKPVTFLIALVGGGLMAAVAGLIVGLPTLRLRGDYLAIATLGFAEIIRVAITNARALGGATGLSVPTYSIEADPGEGVVGYRIFPWIYGAAFLTILVVWRLSRSGKGRAILAVREDEVAAAAIGIDATHHKVLAFIVGAFFAGIAGGLYAHYDGYINPNSFGFMRSVELVVMVTLGGLGSIVGAVIAAIVLAVLPEVLRNTSRGVNEWRMVIYSVLLVAMMIGRSQNWYTKIREALRRRRPDIEPPGFEVMQR